MKTIEHITIIKKEIPVNGKIEVTYKILCKNDFNKEISLSQLLANEKIAKIIKSEFAKGFRNIDLKIENELSDTFKIETNKELYKFEVEKNDFADILALAEDDAASKKLLKKECNLVELVDIKTLD